MKYAALILGFSLFTSMASAQEFIPEASGLTKVANSFVISGDEEPKALWVLKDDNLSKVSVKGGSWDDLEGLATVDDKTFFACTSHSLTKKGKRRPEREQLMLMSLGKEISIKKSWSLRQDVLKYLEKSIGSELNIKEVEAGTPDNGGLNIEGLAYHDGKLFMGLRSPVTKKGEAIILVVTDALSNPTISSSLKLKLSGSGIRSLDATTAGLIVLAGSATDAHEKFSLYALDVKSGKLSNARVSGLEKLLRPEGVALESQDSLLFVQDFEAVENQDVIQRLSR